ncbi:polyprenyl synthetase family protein [Streptococcus sp. zg-JUN1979]|uniref:polyprenyl synthetase family protein n=1 Tax=Streptococcus sp. zg-JUN1979 TaxID=3391450 RepID=UPI0039A477CE
MDKVERINQAIDNYYKQERAVSEQLLEAIFYSINAGGKRIRPLFLLDLLEDFGTCLNQGHYDVAAALEMIHTGSLIHDDLPAMDDDDYRRGRLTSHKQFDEATAILAGDSLFLDPFGLLAQAELVDRHKLALIGRLSKASGSFGMVAGQVLDMAGQEKDLSLVELETIHRNKTGQLLAYPFWAAGILLDLSQPVLSLLESMGYLIGLAFQVRDDILDVTADFETLGKTPQKDLIAEKSTYPRLLGLEASYGKLADCLNQALEHCKAIEEKEAVVLHQTRQWIERLRLDA